MSDIKYSKIENADGKYFTFPFGINDYNDLYVFVNGEFTDAYIFASSISNKDETIIYTNTQVKGTIEAFKISDAEKSMLLDDNKLGKDTQINHLEYIYDLLKERTINVPQIVKEPLKDKLDDLKIYLKHNKNLIVKNLPDQFTYKWLECNGQVEEAGKYPQLIPYLPLTGDNDNYLKIPDLSDTLQRGDIVPVFKIVNFEQEEEEEDLEEQKDPLPELPPDDPYVPPPPPPPEILPEYSGKVLDINTLDLFPNGNSEINDYDENGNPIYYYSDKQVKVSDIEYKIIETSNKELYLLTFKVDSRTINNDITHNYINKDILLIYKYDNNLESFEFEREVDLAFNIKQNFPSFTFNFNFYYFEFYGPNRWESSYMPYYGPEDPLNQSKLYSIKQNSGKPRSMSIESFSMNDIFFDKQLNKIIIPSIPSRFISNNNIVSLLPTFNFDLTDTSHLKANYINSNLDTELYNFIKNRTHEDLWLTYTNYTEQTFVNSFNFAIMDRFMINNNEFIIRGYLSGIGVSALLNESAHLNNKSSLVNLKLNINSGTLSLISEYNSYVGYEENNKLNKGILVRSPFSDAVDSLTSTELNENNKLTFNKADFDFCAFKPILGGVFEDNNSNTYYLAKTLDILPSNSLLYSGISPYFNYYGDFESGYKKDFLKFLNEDFNKAYTYKKHDVLNNTSYYYIPWVFEVEYDIYTGDKLLENKKVIMLENVNDGTFNVVYYESQSTSPIYDLISKNYYFTNDNKIVFSRKYEDINIQYSYYKKLIVDDIEQINTTYKILDITNFYKKNNNINKEYSRIINDKYIYSLYGLYGVGSDKIHTLHRIDNNNLVLSDSDGTLISELDLLDYTRNIPSRTLGSEYILIDKYQRSFYIRDLEQSDNGVYINSEYDYNNYQLFFSLNLKNYDDPLGFDSDGNIELHIDRKLLLK